MFRVDRELNSVYIRNGKNPGKTCCDGIGQF